MIAETARLCSNYAYIVCSKDILQVNAWHQLENANFVSEHRITQHFAEKNSSKLAVLAQTQNAVQVQTKLKPALVPLLVKL